MAVHPLKLLILLVLLFPLVSTPTRACYGPQLYIGVGKGGEQAVLFALVELYLKEKTGIDAEPVPLQGREPRAVLVAEQADLAFGEHSDENSGKGFTALLEVAGLPVLLSGRRPLEDLRFTTVAPALAKFATLLEAAEVRTLSRQVADGEPVKALARRFLTERGWI